MNEFVYNDEDNWDIFTHPIVDNRRYVLWYFDKYGEKQIIQTTFNFHEVKWKVGHYYPDDRFKTRYTSEGKHGPLPECKSLLTIEDLSIEDNKWIPYQIYTKDKGKRVFIYEKYHYFQLFQ